MSWGAGATYSTFTMGSEHTRAEAFTRLQSMGYRCWLDENEGLLLVDVAHATNDTGAVRGMVHRVDPEALVVRR